MEIASTLSSLYFVACAVASGVCSEQRDTDFVEIKPAQPVYACERYKEKHPLDENLLMTAKQEGYKVTLRCDANTEKKIGATDATAEAFVTSCTAKQKCVTDKLAMFNGDGSDVNTDFNRCDANAELLAQPFVALRKKEGYTKFSYSCFPTTEAQ